MILPLPLQPYPCVAQDIKPLIRANITMTKRMILDAFSMFILLIGDRIKSPSVETQARMIACHMKIGDPDWIQTNGPQLRRLLLYSTELQDQLVSKYKR